MRVLAMPHGHGLAHVSRALEVARQLRELGHQVAFAGQGKYLELCAEVGFEVHDVESLGLERSMVRSREGRLDWYDDATLDRHVRAEEAAYRRLRPDVVLGDFRLSLGVSCDLTGVPLAVLLNAAWTNHYLVRDRAPEHSAFTRALTRPLATALLPAIKSLVLWRDNRVFRRARRRLGLRPRDNVFDSWLGDLNLLTDIPAYGPTRDLPDGFHYVGPIVWEPTLPRPDFLDRLDPSRPVLYITMGSTGDPSFFQRAIELFGDTAWQCIITTAGLATIERPPANFFVVEYAPGSAIMAVSDVVMCQGGNGTIYQALGAGVPIVGIPMMMDQEFNMDRVEALGVGIQVSEIQFNPARLKAAVERLLVDRGYRWRARHYAELIAGYDGPRRAAELIAATPWTSDATRRLTA